MKRSIVLLTLLGLAVAAGCHVRARANVTVGHGGGGTGGRGTGGNVTVRAPGNQGGGPAAGGCTSSDQCSDGMICIGEEGCGEPWSCQPPRPCTRDLVVFCGCNGQTFRGSSTCPGRPVRHRGVCEGDEGGAATPPRLAPAPHGRVEVNLPTPPQTAPPPHGRVEGRLPTPSAGNVAQGGACTASAECADGLMCLGHQGCNSPMTCEPRRPCTLDLRTYCGCNGQPFRGSGTCPSQNFVNRGACVSDGPVSTPAEQ